MEDPWAAWGSPKAGTKPEIAPPRLSLSPPPGELDDLDADPWAAKPANTNGRAKAAGAGPDAARGPAAGSTTAAASAAVSSSPSGSPSKTFNIPLGRFGALASAQATVTVPNLARPRSTLWEDVGGGWGSPKAEPEPLPEPLPKFERPADLSSGWGDRASADDGDIGMVGAPTSSVSPTKSRSPVSPALARARFSLDAGTLSARASLDLNPAAVALPLSRELSRVSSHLSSAHASARGSFDLAPIPYPSVPDVSDRVDATAAALSSTFAGLRSLRQSLEADVASARASLDIERPSLSSLSPKSDTVRDTSPQLPSLEIAIGGGFGADEPPLERSLNADRRGSDIRREPSPLSDFGGFDASDPWDGNAAADDWGKSPDADEADTSMRTVGDEEDTAAGYGWGDVRPVAATPKPAQESEWEAEQARLAAAEARAPHAKVAELKREWDAVAGSLISEPPFGDSDKEGDEARARAEAADRELDDGAAALRANTVDVLASLATIPPDVNTYAPVMSSLATHKKYTAALARANPNPQTSLLHAPIRTRRLDPLSFGTGIEGTWSGRSHLGEPEEAPKPQQPKDEPVQKGWSFWRRSTAPKSLTTSGGGVLEIKTPTDTPTSASGSTGAVTPIPPVVAKSTPTSPPVAETASISSLASLASPASTPPVTATPVPLKPRTSSSRAGSIASLSHASTPKRVLTPTHGPQASLSQAALDMHDVLAPVPVLPADALPAHSEPPEVPPASAMSRFLGRFGRRSGSPAALATDEPEHDDHDDAEMELSAADIAFLDQVPAVPAMSSMPQRGRTGSPLGNIRPPSPSKLASVPAPLAAPPRSSSTASQSSLSGSKRFQARMAQPQRQASNIDLLAGLFDDTPEPAGRASHSATNSASHSAAQSPLYAGWEDILAPSGSKRASSIPAIAPPPARAAISPHSRSGSGLPTPPLPPPSGRSTPPLAAARAISPPPRTSSPSPLASSITATGVRTTGRGSIGGAGGPPGRLGSMDNILAPSPVSHRPSSPAPVRVGSPSMPPLVPNKAPAMGMSMVPLAPSPPPAQRPQPPSLGFNMAPLAPSASSMSSMSSPPLQPQPRAAHQPPQPSPGMSLPPLVPTQSTLTLTPTPSTSAPAPAPAPPADDFGDFDDFADFSAPPASGAGATTGFDDFGDFGDFGSFGNFGSFASPPAVAPVPAQARAVTPALSSLSSGSLPPTPIAKTSPASPAPAPLPKDSPRAGFGSFPHHSPVSGGGVGQSLLGGPPRAGTAGSGTSAGTSPSPFMGMGFIGTGNSRPSSATSPSFPLPPPPAPGRAPRVPPAPPISTRQSPPPKHEGSPTKVDHAATLTLMTSASNSPRWPRPGPLSPPLPAIGPPPSAARGVRKAVVEDLLGD